MGSVPRNSIFIDYRMRVVSLTLTLSKYILPHYVQA